MPEISVVIPTFNMARFVGEAVRSVLDQTFADFEVLVVDDGSTDNTREVIAAIDDPRVRYLHQENRGLAGARNAGIEAARGSFIAFLDADDLWLPDKLARQRQLFADRPWVGLVYTGAYVMEGGQVFACHRGRYRGHVVRELLTVDNIVVGSGSAAMVRRECFDRVGLFDESLSACEDWDMWLRIAARYPFDFVEQPLVKLRTHAGGMQRQAERMHRATRALFDKILADPALSDHVRETRTQVTSLADFMVGRSYYFAREMPEARRYFLRSLRAHPLQARAWEYLLRSLLGRRLTEVARTGRNRLRHALRFRGR